MECVSTTNRAGRIPGRKDLSMKEVFVSKIKVKNIPQVISAIARMTGRLKDQNIKEICKKIKRTGQADSFDYTRFKGGYTEYDCVIYLDYNAITKTWLIEID